ncbi:carbohydrate kinase [Jannaschia sp. LMIT008]|uniref:carbohydrate kinase family protein n=1 Tax=Jannaschia maritima TaxID=3032585 RepID=UPI00281236AA|nr:carbohydrate kinase [Jannaschia sp. LMIT008]
MILCAGEALIDMLPRDTPEGSAFLPVVGGSVFNTARACARLGAPTAMFTGLSTDLFGQRLHAALTADGVADRTHRSDRPTTLAFVTLTDGQAEYAFYDENTAARTVDIADAPPMDDVTALFLGCISLAVEPCATAYEALADANPGLPLYLDTNIRAGFVADEAAYRARLDRLMSRAAMVKMSDDDAAWLGLSAADVLDRGASVVCTTHGADGVTAHTARGRVHVPAVAVTVVDTVGAGDTFNGGFLAGLHEAGALHRDVPDDDVLRLALELGARAAAITVSRAGANPPTRAEIV